jgi:hypothetical protein
MILAREMQDDFKASLEAKLSSIFFPTSVGSFRSNGIQECLKYYTNSAS